MTMSCVSQSSLLDAREKLTSFQVALLALSPQPPKMEWHPNHQTEENDRVGNLNPDNPANFLEHHFKARAPRLRQLIRQGFDRMGHKPEPISDPLGMVDEGGEDQQPGCSHRQKPEGVRLRQLADGRTLRGWNGHEDVCCSLRARVQKLRQPSSRRSARQYRPL